MLQEQYNV